MRMLAILTTGKYKLKQNTIHTLKNMLTTKVKENIGK